jgi:peptide/nickel transport system substrate-binding protein
MRKSFISVLVFFVMLFAATMVGFAAGPKASYKPEIIIAPSLGFTSMDVQVTTSATDKSVYVMVFDTLCARDNATGEIIPGLAESWRQINPTKLEFKLRRGVKFHDGTPFTAKDVKFTMERAKTQSGTKSRLTTVESITAVDDYTITLNMAQQDVDIIYKLTDPGFSILSSDAFSKLPPAQAFKIGTGAFRYGDWIQGDRLSLIRNTGYWGEGSLSEKITIRFIPEAASRLIALQTGEIDVCIDPSAVDLQFIVKDKKLTLMQIPSTNIRYIGINMSKEPFTRRQVREAIAYALRRDEFVTLVYEGNAMIANNVMHPEYMFYKKIDGFSYNPAKAKLLLAEAGLPNGFSATIFSSQGTTQKAVATVLQAQLAEIGIKLNIQTLETATFNATVAAGQPFDMMVNGWGGYAIGPDNALRPHFHSTGTSNRYQIKDKYIDQMLDKGLSTTDVNERAKIYGELQKYITDQAVFIPIAVELINVGLKAGIKGFRLPNGLFHDFRYVNLAQ